ncbi:hypothetical protein N9937_00760 [bacterium]|nr:hypothetical protein [bacterium]
MTNNHDNHGTNDGGPVTPKAEVELRKKLVEVQAKYDRLLTAARNLESVGFMVIDDNSSAGYMLTQLLK